MNNLLDSFTWIENNGEKPDFQYAELEISDGRCIKTNLFVEKWHWSVQIPKYIRRYKEITFDEYKCWLDSMYNGRKVGNCTIKLVMGHQGTEL